ncbi:MAG: hypothetical protein KME27_10915 [Lyngbya sp. HA4199-MV5]|nr:hypothetical protein [Lyngbya sp. HA4199-MV5]
MILISPEAIAYRHRASLRTIDDLQYLCNFYSIVPSPATLERVWLKLQQKEVGF